MYNLGIYNHAVLGKVVHTVKNAKNFILVYMNTLKLYFFYTLFLSAHYF